MRLNAFLGINEHMTLREFVLLEEIKAIHWIKLDFEEPNRTNPRSYFASVKFFSLSILGTFKFAEICNTFMHNLLFLFSVTRHLSS